SVACDRASTGRSSPTPFPGRKSLPGRAPRRYEESPAGGGVGFFDTGVFEMRSPRAFLQPLAIGAPQPLREVPFKPSRMIHFFDPSNPKMAAKVPDISKKVDILLGNLEDAIQSDKKVDAREGLIKIARETDFGETQLWTRVNSLDSPWVLDDFTRLVTEIGDKLDVIMVP